MSDKYKATTRKRKACSQLRALASELGVARVGRSADLKRDEFENLLTTVVNQCQTPEQRSRADDVRKLYHDELPAEVPCTDAVPPEFPLLGGPPEPAGIAAASASNNTSTVRLPELPGGSSLGRSSTVQAPQTAEASTENATKKEFRLRSSGAPLQCAGID